MRKCILHLTDHEVAKLLQLNHDALVFTTRDETLLDGLGGLLGKSAVDEVRCYDECRVQQHDALDGIARVEEDLAEPVGAAR